jgi:TM2 domain-containing membrane protein YozV
MQYTGTYGSAPPPDPAANPYMQQTAQPLQTHSIRTSPGLAFLLGLIPGVGAIYNAQYVKGFLHVAIFGLLITLLSSDHGGSEVFLGILTAGWYAYMPFEAYHTATRRQLGIAVDEWSGLLPKGTVSGRVPVGPIVLIVLGVVFLLSEFDLIRFSEITRFWPVLLILIGAYSLFNRFSPGHRVPPPVYPTTGTPSEPGVEVRHEQ